MQRESKARTPGETHTRLVAGIMATGILCAASGGVAIRGGSPFADFVSYSASIFTIFAFVATLLQLHSIRRVREEKRELVDQVTEKQLRKGLRDEITAIGWELEILKAEIHYNRHASAGAIVELLVKKYNRLGSGTLGSRIASLKRKLRICASELSNLRAILRISESGRGEKPWKKETMFEIITYIEKENGSIIGGGEPGRGENEIFNE